MKPALECLLYRSKMANRIGPLHMQLLVNRARQTNLEHGITARLIYLDHTFLQYIEGPSTSVNGLWVALQKDPRHQDVELMHQETIARRRFPGCPLAFASNSYFGAYQMEGFTIASPKDMVRLKQMCTTPITDEGPFSP